MHYVSLAVPSATLPHSALSLIPMVSGVLPVGPETPPTAKKKKTVSTAAVNLKSFLAY